ncbi:MAG: oxidoreductase [Gammaproteobacteria bacterium]|nr:oxidoreductase [Gammaproteobacteria bacterium]
MNSAVSQRDARPPALRLGFLGLGWIGLKRLEAVAALPQVEVAMLADSNAERLDAARRRHRDAAAVTDIDELLRGDLDGVVIATPNGWHAEQAVRCLTEGLAVFCQKPLATNARDAARVIDAARRADRLLGVDFCYRHVQGMDQLRRRIASGDLGRISSIDLVFHNAYAPDKGWCFDRTLAGGGCLLDLGSHLIDLALWLQGNPPLTLTSRHLFARGDAIDALRIEDLALAEFQRPDGAAVRIACSWNAHSGRDAIIGARIMGSRGGAAWGNVNGSFYDFELEVFKSTERERLGGYPDDWGSRALEAWVRRLSHDRSFDPQADDFLHGARLIDAVYAR